MSSFIPYQQGARPAVAKGAADFLRSHDKMAALLPAALRMAALQKDCASALPVMFDTCAILQFEAGQLVLSTPNAALAAKLKQQLPKLQDTLQQRGWQVQAIKLKIQVSKIHATPPPPKRLELSEPARNAFAELGEALEDSPRNRALKAALAAMVRRHRNAK